VRRSVISRGCGECEGSSPPRPAPCRPALKNRAAWPFASVAVAGFAAAMVLTGCANTRLGAAMLYGDQRVSSSKLADEVANLNYAYQKYKGRIQVSYSPADMPRQVLSWMLRFATADQLADRLRIHVTPTQADRALALETSNIESAGETLPEAAVINGLPPNMLPQLGTWIEIQIQADERLDHGVTPKTTAGSDALAVQLTKLECFAAKSLDIKVNPQYGVYDFSSFMVVPASTPLSTTSPAPNATPSAAPQTTPKC
jgi:hypothetical protein